MRESDAFIMKECERLMINACLRSRSCKNCPSYEGISRGYPVCGFNIGAPELKEDDIDEDDQDAGNI